ncbi:MAG: SDR family oxidoreductase [Acidobacteriota bacterium]|nr:SDR family oxidoreductase [Acidobacteriota bacterium]
MQLKDKVALVTGGATGIGLAVARQFSDEGATVVICGRNRERLEAAALSIGGAGAVHPWPLDVTDRTRVGELVGKAIERFGKIDILVNNAGVNVVERTMERIEPESWDYIMAVNATGAFNVAAEVLPHMRGRGDGLIVNVTSTAGCRASDLGGAAYSASKHAMDAFTKVVSLEEGHRGVRATVVAPGEVDTPLLEVRPVAVSDEHRAQILRPEDVAAAVLFVATLPPRAHVPELIIKPINQAFA